MLTEAFFKKHKLTSEDLKAVFTKKEFTAPSPMRPDPAAEHKEHDTTLKGQTEQVMAAWGYEEGISGLVHRIQQRVNDGITRSLGEAHIYWAIDKAYDAPFHQVSPTLLEHLLDNEPDTKKVESAVKDWGLSHLITTSCSGCKATPCSCSAGDSRKVLNVPVFFRVFVPLVKAYVTIRWAKLYGDRNVHPLFKYEPAINTALNRIRTEILTSRVQMMSTQMGYNAIMRQEIFQALLYSFALSFPKEAWYREKKRFVGDDETKDVVTKEGIRYNVPHPSRVFYDTSDRLGTFNTDTGCSFAGYWNIVPYREIADGPYWNKSAVSYGDDLIANHASYFQEIAPCSLRYPSGNLPGNSQDGVFMGAAPQLRDERLNRFYTVADADKAATMVEYFERINPSRDLKRPGVEEYDGDVWVRFVVAGRDTVVYAQPLTSCPVIYTGYDADENRARNASLALEAMPFQDHIGNLLSQYLLSVKQNLTKVVFYNEDIVDGGDIDNIKNSGRKKFEAINWIPFRGKEQRMFAETGPEQAYYNVGFPQQNTQEIGSCISAVIGIMERLLGMSAQEMGQPASHEQSANEVLIIGNNATTRLNFTGSFVDDAINARKTQLYYGLMGLGSEEVYTQIEAENPISAATLETLGFDVVDDHNERVTARVIEAGEVVTVRGKKSNMLVLEGFSSNRDGQDRINGPQVAQAMGNFLQSLSANQGLVQLVGPREAVKLLNQIISVAGLPKDFALKVNPEILQQQGQNPQDMMAQVAQAIQGVQSDQQKLVQDIGEALKPLQETLAQLSTNDQQQNEVITDVVQQLQTLSQVLQAAPQPPPNAFPPAAPAASF